MNRLVTPLTAALALTLAAPAALASPGGPVRSTMASWSAPGYAQPGVVVETAPAPAPAPAPQPYADPSAPAAPAAEGPQPYVGPQPYADPASQPQPAPQPRGRRKGLMIGGWVMFGASYLATAFISAIVADSCRALDERGCRNAALTAMIPVVGPFMAIPYMQTDYITPKVFMAFPGLVQTAGLIMGIVGTVRFVRDGREPRYVGVDGFKLGPKLRLGVAPTRFHDGGTFTLGYRF